MLRNGFKFHIRYFVMKIGVISDTHLRSPTTRFFSLLRKYLSDVDLIIHAGDIVSLKIIEILSDFARTEAVLGNMDSVELSSILEPKKILHLSGFNIGIIHGWGSPDGITERIRKEFENVDAIIFGHTHSPLNEKREGVLFFNPGSPFDTIYAPFNSIGIIRIEEDLKGEIIRL